MKIIYLIPSIDVRGVSFLLECASHMAQNGHEISILTLDPLKKASKYPTAIQSLSVMEINDDYYDVDAIIAYTSVCLFHLDSIKTKANKFALITDDERDYLSKESIRKLSNTTDERRIERELKSQIEFVQKSYSLPMTYIVPNRKMKSRIASIGRPTTLVPVGVNHELFYPEQTFPKTEMPRLTFQVGQMSWMNTKAIARAISQMMQVEIWTVGSGIYEFRSDKQWGNVSANQLRRIISSSDVYINLNEIDGTGEQILQVMACGTAVVCRKSIGARMFCSDKNNCFYVGGDSEKEKAESLRSVLEIITNDDEIKNSLVLNGLKTAKDMSWDIRPMEEAIWIAQHHRG